MKSTKMTLFTAIAMSLSLLASASSQASGQANQAGAAARSGTATQESKPLKITRNSSPPPQMREAENFMGSVGVEMLMEATAPSPLSVGRVTFTPGARTAWHSHLLGQPLIVTAGAGWVQQEGGEKQEIKVGDVVWTPPGVKHWHGATTTDRLTHIALTEQQPKGKRVEWMEKVSDAQYNAPTKVQAVPAPVRLSTSDNRLSARAMGDFAPKLAELTDDVLYADVWERPQLSKRDRSLVTVAALIALNRPDQIRSRAHEWRDKRRDHRNDYAIGVLRGLAERDYRDWRSQRSFPTKLIDSMLRTGCDLSSGVTKSTYSSP